MRRRTRPRATRKWCLSSRSSSSSGSRWPPLSSPMAPSSSTWDARLIAALAAAKATGAAIRGLGRGGGTAAPGLVAERIDPQLLDKIARRLPQGTVVVAGTNGKTTVSRMLADILQAHGSRVAHNRSGSNLVRGVASALASQADLTGSPRADIGVIESDEAAFPEIVRRVQPSVVLLNNLFRDQLDRYGELDTIALQWAPALRRLPAEATVVVNADDPTLAAITEGISARRVTFGLDDRNPSFLLDEIPHAADAKTCRRCGRDLAYDRLYSAHLGAWRCPGCGVGRPPLDFAGSSIVLDGVDGLRLEVSLAAQPETPIPLQLMIPGLYNAYNAVAATAVAGTLGVPPQTIAGALRGYRSAFGRIELDAAKRRSVPAQRSGDGLRRHPERACHGGRGDRVVGVVEPRNHELQGDRGLWLRGERDFESQTVNAIQHD